MKNKINFKKVWETFVNVLIIPVFAFFGFLFISVVAGLNIIFALFYSCLMACAFAIYIFYLNLQIKKAKDEGFIE